MTVLTIATMVLIVGAANTFQDQPEPTRLDALSACPNIANEADRLACFEEQFAAFSAAVEEGVVVVVEREAVRAVERETFGLSVPSLAGVMRGFGRGRLSETADSEAQIESETLEDGSVITYSTDGVIDEMLNLPVVEITRNRSDRLVITLANGQVWQQSNQGRIRMPTRREREELTANITNGAFGSFRMRLNHARGAFSVRRVN